MNMTTVSTINDNYEHFTFDYTKYNGSCKGYVRKFRIHVRP